MRARGQGTVELALGSLVFITVLLFGIHFAEFGWLSLKVQEAQTWALWESTGPRVQKLPNGAANTIDFDNTLARLGPTATREYRDFDGRTGVNRGGVIVAALTRAENLTVECQEERGLSGAAGNGNWRPSPSVVNVYSDRGGVSCLAKAELEGFRIPTKFLQNSANGFFKADHRKPNPYTFCGIGPSNGMGACTGRIAILTNDWGLAGDSEKGQQPAPVAGGGANPDYADAVRSIWTADGMAGANLANAFAGDAPTDASEFWFSYAGIEVGHLSPISGHGPAGPWNTGSPGIGNVPNGSETRCFLGKDHIPGGACD